MSDHDQMVLAMLICSTAAFFMGRFHALGVFHWPKKDEEDESQDY